MTSAEELIPDRTPNRTATNPTAQVTKPTLVPRKDEPATDKQMQVLHSLAMQLGFKPEDISQLNTLTKSQASQTITELSGKVRAQRTERSASSL